jgi:general secretion pathway protein D
VTSGFALAGAVILLLAGVCRGQPEPPTPVAPTPATTLGGQVPLARLVDLASERLGVAIDYDSTALGVSVTLRSPASIKDDELWALVNQLLATRGFTTVRQPGTKGYSVVKVTDAAGSAPLGPGQAATARAGFETAVIRATNRPSKEVVEAIGKLLSKPAGAAQAVGDGGLIVVSDFSDRVAEISRLLPQIDVRGPELRIIEIVPRNITPAALVTSATQIAAKRALLSDRGPAGELLAAPSGRGVLVVAPESSLPYWRDFVERLDTREATLTRTYSPHAFTAQDVADLIEKAVGPADSKSGWRIVTDELTGSLIVTATPTQHGEIEALLARLESAPGAAKRPVRTYVIRNRSVLEIKTVLEDLLAAGALRSDSGEPGPDAQPAKPEAAAPLSPPPATPPIPPSEAVIQMPPRPPDTVKEPAQTQHPTGTASSHASRNTPAESPVTLTVDEGTSTLIATGDPRVLNQIETLLKTLDVRQPQVMLEVMMVSLTEAQSLQLGVELEEIQISGDIRIRLSSLFGLGTGPGAGLTTPPGSGFTGVVLSPGDFSVLVRALQTINNGRSMSMPKLLVANNQEATLDSVLEQPYASINATNTVSTSSYGGSKPAGTQVSIKPQIAEGDSLILSYTVSLSAFTAAAASAALPPPRQENKVQSVATIPDGYTVVVGGIELSTDSKNIDQVPLLGSIPIIGEVFKTRTNNSSHSRFFVFIRAGIIRNQGFEELKYISDRDVAKSGVDDGWPEVEPLVIR